MPKEDLLERLVSRINVMDTNSAQRFIMQLAKEKGFLETIFNTVHEGILIIDRSLKIKYFNQQASEMLGLPENISSVRISQFIQGVNWKKILGQDREEWQKISRHEIEIRYPEQRIVQFYLVPHEKNHQLASLILIDVTQNRNETIEQIESQKLQAISMLAASVAHELGNPLNSLSLHLQLLEREIEDDSLDKEEALELIATARNEISRLDVIVKQFLTSIRPGKPVMEMTDIKKVIIESLNFMRQEIENRKILIKCDWPDFMPQIKADSNLLKQAIYNILKNSIQAMQEKGKISISCSHNNGIIEIIFTDTGPGISQEEIGSVFQPFHTSKQTGSGLGLMIVEKIIREHGADLAIETEPGKGTSIIIKFYIHGRRVQFLPESEDSFIDTNITSKTKEQDNEQEQ